VEALYAGGSQVDPGWYDVDDRLGVIRWVRGGDAPSEAIAFLRLTKELSAKDLSPFWKKVNVLIPVFVAVATGGLTYLSTRASSPPKPCPVVTCPTCPPVKGDLHSNPRSSPNYKDVLSRFMQAQPPSPYGEYGYIDDLDGLAESLAAFVKHVDQVQSSGKTVSEQEVSQFENDLNGAVNMMQHRCYDKLGRAGDINVQLHCGDGQDGSSNIGQFKGIASWVPQAMRGPDHRLSGAWVDYLRRDIDHWRYGAWVFPNPYPQHPPFPT
jgi:hypothetical protein